MTKAKRGAPRAKVARSIQVSVRLTDQEAEDFGAEISAISAATQTDITMSDYLRFAGRHARGNHPALRGAK